MRVGLGQTSARGRAPRLRPAHEPARDGKPPDEAPADDAFDPGTDRRLDDERRMRAAGGPEDRGHYSCVCGYQFEADVSTSVACPHCGTGQAW